MLPAALVSADIAAVMDSVHVYAFWLRIPEPSDTTVWLSCAELPSTGIIPSTWSAVEEIWAECRVIGYTGSGF